MRNLGIWEPANEYTKWLEKETSAFTKSNEDKGSKQNHKEQDLESSEIECCYSSHNIKTIIEQIKYLSGLNVQLINRLESLALGKDANGLTVKEIIFLLDYNYQLINELVQEDMALASDNRSLQLK